MTQDWRYPVNQLLYSLTYSSDIDEAMVNFNASSAVDYTTLNLGPEAYSRAIKEALASGEQLDSLSLLPQFDQAQLAGFLRAVSARLDELRPWPQPEVRPLAPETWTEFGHAKPVAALDASVVEVTDVLQQGFKPVGNSQPGMNVLMLWLGTGETVALVGFYGRGEKVTLLADPAVDPSTVVDHFIAATGFPAEKTNML
jgi:hypothetical protein